MPTKEEEALLKALDDLEKHSVRKGGDALQNAPHDGGFASEGTNIQAKAKAAKAAMMKGGMSEEEADAILKGIGGGGDDDAMSSDDSASDDGDEMTSSPDEEAPPMAKSKMKKSTTGAAQLANASSSRKSGDTLKKALVDENPQMEGAIDALPILGKFIDQLAKTNQLTDASARTLKKSLDAIAQANTDFNTRMAKSQVAAFDRFNALEAKLDKLLSEPVANNRSGNIRKSDIVQPQFHDGNASSFGGPGAEERSPLFEMEPMKIQKALVDLAMEGKVDVMEVTKFENEHCNIATLPPQIRKSLEAKLCPAAA